MRVNTLATASIASHAVLAFKPNPQEKVFNMSNTNEGHIRTGKDLAGVRTEVAFHNQHGMETTKAISRTKVFPSTISEDERAMAAADADIFPSLDSPVELNLHHAPSKIHKALACMHQLLLLQQQAEAIQTQDLLVIPAHQNANTFYRTNDIVTTTGITLEGLDDLLLKAIEQKALSVQAALAEAGVNLDVYELLGIPSYAG